MSFEKATKGGGATDMGNVTHVIPSIHPHFSIPSKDGNHTKGFAEAAGTPEAQEPTLTAAKALAMTCLSLMRSPETLEKARQQFKQDLIDDSVV